MYIYIYSTIEGSFFQLSVFYGLVQWVVSVFLTAIQGFMKPVFAKAKMGFVETAEKGTFSDREVGSEQKTSGNRISGRSFAKRTVPLHKNIRTHPSGSCLFFLAVIQGFMKPVFAKQKWGSSQQPQRRVSLCGLWSREHTQFFAKRPQRSKNA